jgi:predicted GNAT superfamily acetyltransferase
MVECVLLSPEASSWDHIVDSIRFPSASAFPAHFLKRTFPKIGGRLYRVSRAGTLVGTALLFPRGLRNSQSFTVRWETWEAGQELDPQDVLNILTATLPGVDLQLYDTRAEVGWEDIGVAPAGDLVPRRPTSNEAKAIRALQKEIWGAEESGLYPADIHSPTFALPSSLVAVENQELVAFLFGFAKIGGTPLPDRWSEHVGPAGDRHRIESQVLGVRESHRHRGIGLRLKGAQARLALACGVRVINWTVDPLLFGNAVVNFRKLGAVAYRFLRAYYPFNNSLNRVSAASRVEVTWLLEAARIDSEVREELSSADIEGIPCANVGFRSAQFDLAADRIRVEIPFDWTALQKENRTDADRWRSTTDSVFETYLNGPGGPFMITNVANVGSAAYLILERMTEKRLSQHLGALA